MGYTAIQDLSSPPPKFHAFLKNLQKKPALIENTFRDDFGRPELSYLRSEALSIERAGTAKESRAFEKIFTKEPNMVVSQTKHKDKRSTV